MEFVGGFELVRRLGAGSRAEVFLGRGGASPGSRSTAGVALKIYRASTPVEAIESEIEALSRTDSDHLLRVIDVTTAPDRKPALILSPVGVRRLSDLIVGSRGLSLGEVVTATAPIVGAVAELHRVGISHGALRLSNIVFDRRGTPVVVGFGRAELIGERPTDATGQSLPPAVVSKSPAIAADLADLAVVIRCVCAASPADTSSVRDQLDALTQSRDPTLWLAQLEAALYDLAPGEPVCFDGQAIQHSSLATHLVASSPLTPDEAESGTVVHGERRSALIEARDARRTSFGQTIGLPQPVLDLMRTPLPHTARRLLDSARAVRRPFWLAGGAAAALLVAAVLLIPDDGGAPANAVQPPAIVTPSPSGSMGPELQSSARPGDDRTTSGGVDTGEQPEAIRGDDPAAALAALVAARTRCLDTRSLQCLEQVDQHGSAAWDADSTFFERYEAGQPTDPLLRAAAESTVTDHLGDSAIASVADASTDIRFTVLLIRGEDGWRIRDIIAP